MDDNSIPYEFDLWFDIKSREALVRTYAQLKQDLASMDRIMSAQGMEFTPEELAAMTPEPDAEDPPAGPQAT